VSIPRGSAGPDPHNNLIVRVLYGLDPHNNLANVKKGHQQRFFTLKMHPNRWRLGLCPRPHWESLQCSPRPHSWIKGAYFEGEGRGWEGRGKEGRGGTLDTHNVEDRLTPLRLHLDTVPNFPSIPAGHVQWANTELASVLVVAKLDHGNLHGMVWTEVHINSI